MHVVALAWEVCDTVYGNGGAEAELPKGCVVSSELQPKPWVLSSELVLFTKQEYLAPSRGVSTAYRYTPVVFPSQEPQDVDELLARATSMIGATVSIAADKGGAGQRVEAMLGLARSSNSEPDWRGEVEIKTVPVDKSQEGLWRVKEDPAIAMDTVVPYSKLAQVLWVVRASEKDSYVLTWFYQQMTPAVRILADRYLHKRPKGGAGSHRKGWYLHKSFFKRCGLLWFLNQGLGTQKVQGE